MTSVNPTVGFYRIFDEHLMVMSESDWMSHHIHCFMHLLEEQCEEPTAKLAVLQGRRISQTQMLQLCCPELNYAATKACGVKSWLGFRRVFSGLALHPSLPHYVLHASSVTNGRGQTALVVGVSDAGKTSTMLGLLRQGYTYVCDDYSCLRFSDGKLLALAVGCTVTERTFELFPELEELRSDNCKFHCQGEWQWTINPGDLYPTVDAYTPLEPTHIFFLYPDYGNKSRVIPLGRDESVWMFHEGRFAVRPSMAVPVSSALAEHERAFALTQKVLANASCYRVMNGNIHDTVAMIQEAFDTVDEPALV